MINTCPRVVIMGPPGSGKSTQAEILAHRLGIPYISTGDLLRFIASQNTSLGNEIKAYLDRGEIVSDDLTVQLIVTIVSKDEYKHGYVGEGFPRTVIQAEAMDSLIDYVIYIKIADSVVIKRLLSRLSCPKCGENYNLITQPPLIQGVCDHCQTKLTSRSDDTKAIILNRLKVYHQTTEPVIAYFQSKNKLIVINGEPEVEIVSKNILNIIAKCVPNKVESDSTKWGTNEAI